tara:strand:+ start:107595 stop:107897 length:303 start_codon:yes stop_codon:yes gene_type:complete
MKIAYLLASLALFSFNVHADDSTLDAAIGAGIGGAVGAAIGNEVGGREGAIIGGGLGGATGAAIATDGQVQHKDNHNRGYIEPKHTHKFCPPGQAKKGNC